MSKEKLIPELRFPEFKNEGEWKESILGSVVEMKGRIGYRGYTTEDIVDRGKGAITLSPSNFNENGHLNFDKCTYISWAKYEESPEIQLEEGQTVLVKTASVGKTAYVDKLPEKATVNPQIVVLKPKTIHNRFLSFTVLHQNTQTQIRNNVGAGAIPNISQEIISKIKILIPPDRERKEQQKIATCLSSLDEVFAAHSQKLELLKDHKKGLMQNLFPQEGEKVPKYRFKEFENDADWVEKSIEQIAKVTTGNKDTQNKVENGLYPFFVRSQTVERINSYSFDGEAILTSGDGVGVGKNFHYLKGKFDYHQRVYCIYDFKNDVSGEFVYMYFSQHFNERVMKMSAKNSVDSVRMAMITEMPIYMPSKKEQQKIASCLSSLDTLITAQAEKIEQLKLHKKGLMQGLFPKIND